ncbi:MAG: alpha-L-fucosidase [Myxococcales bacterium]
MRPNLLRWQYDGYRDYHADRVNCLSTSSPHLAGPGWPELTGRAEEGDVHYKPSAENLEARRWFEDARFGLFVHWGVCSLLGDGEWVMENRKMGITEYERLPPMFNPTAFKPAEWVALAKHA